MAIEALNYQYYARLARRIREGDSDAFAELYENTYADLRRYVFYFLRDPDAVDDVLQEVYISVYRNIDRLQLDRVLLPWIKQIAYHECCDYLRRPAVNREQPAELPAEEGNLVRAVLEREEDCFQAVYDRDFLQTLHRELNKLPVNERRAFQLRYEHELKLEEVADFMGVSLASVKRYILRARTALQKSLSGYKETV